MKAKFKIQALLALCVTMILASCTYFDEEVGEYTEVPKSIVGTWKIKTAYRNNVDITEMMDFSQFRLNMNEDGTYTIDGYLPFIVKNDGTYELDDPLYPFHILFSQEGDTEPLETGLSFPIVNADRQIGLTFSPGCFSNRYTYLLERNTVN